MEAKKSSGNGQTTAINFHDAAWSGQSFETYLAFISAEEDHYDRDKNKFLEEPEKRQELREHIITMTSRHFTAMIKEHSHHPQIHRVVRPVLMWLASIGSEDGSNAGLEEASDLASKVFIDQDNKNPNSPLHVSATRTCVLLASKRAKRNNNDEDAMISINRILDQLDMHHPLRERVGEMYIKLIYKWDDHGKALKAAWDTFDKSAKGGRLEAMAAKVCLAVAAKLYEEYPHKAIEAYEYLRRQPHEIHQAYAAELRKFYDKYIEAKRMSVEQFAEQMRLAQS